MKSTTLLFVALLLTGACYAQSSSVKDAYGYYDIGKRTLEIRKSDEAKPGAEAIEVDGKTYSFYATTDEALEAFEHPTGAYKDYTLVYVEGNPNDDAELYELERKALKHKYSYMTELEEEIITIRKVK